MMMMAFNFKERSCNKGVEYLEAVDDQNRFAGKGMLNPNTSPFFALRLSTYSTYSTVLAVRSFAHFFTHTHSPSSWYKTPPDACRLITTGLSSTPNTHPPSHEAGWLIRMHTQPATRLIEMQRRVCVAPHVNICNLLHFSVRTTFPCLLPTQASLGFLYLKNITQIRYYLVKTS